MFFKNYFNGISEAVDAKYRAYNRHKINSADIGELCELFIKEILIDCLDDHYKIFRGGNITDNTGQKSGQLDIVITNKSALKIFGDKGIYPIESVSAVFSITSNLTLAKLKKCMTELGKIPKEKYCFKIESFYGEGFEKKVKKAWETLIPFTCVFGFKGNISEKWIKGINEEAQKISDKSLLPVLIIVNKKGIIERNQLSNKVIYEFTSIDDKEKYGEWLSRLLFRLFDISRVQTFLSPKYEYYFSKDYE
ncbi:MAG TPA: DUF6602 domain-containing protein [Chitinophagaceae bacterium]|nr:DUF6602 domain-containing protein [Chitinophagaceae bacterium]